MRKIILSLMLISFISSAVANAGQLQKLIDAAQPNSTITVKKGVYKEPIVIKKPLKLICEKGAVIDGLGKDDVVTIKNTKDVLIKGCVLRHSGTHGWKMDAGVKIVNARNCTVENNRILDCLYGIVTKTAKNCKLIGNEIASKKGYSEGAKGDAIRLWWSPNVLVKDNYVHDSRDVTSMFSNGVVFENNRVENSHIGTMVVNSNANRIIGFKGKNNEVSLLLNCAEDCTIKDFNIKDDGKYRGLVMIRASNTHVSNGLIENCKKGLVVNLSPAKAGTKNYFDNIKLHNNEIGIYIHTTAKQRSRNIFRNIEYKNNKTNFMDEWKTHK